MGQSPLQQKQQKHRRQNAACHTCPLICAPTCRSVPVSQSLMIKHILPRAFEPSTQHHRAAVRRAADAPQGCLPQAPQTHPLLPQFWTISVCIRTSGRHKVTRPVLLKTILHRHVGLRPPTSVTPLLWKMDHKSHPQPPAVTRSECLPPNAA